MKLHKTLSALGACALMLTTSLTTIAKAAGFTDEQENQVAARAEICLHEAMRATVPGYKAKMPLYSTTSTGIEHGTTDDRTRIEVMLDRKKGTVGAIIEREVISFSYKGGKAIPTGQSYAKLTVSDITDPASAAVMASTSGKKVPNGLALSVDVLKLGESFAECMAAPVPASPKSMTIGPVESEYVRGKLKAGMTAQP